MRKKKGSVVLLVLAGLIIFGAVAVIWTMSGVAVASVQRTYDNFQQTQADDARFERVVQEALQAMRGTQFDRSTLDISQELTNRVGGLNAGLAGGSPLLASTVNWPATIPNLPMYPEAAPALGPVPSDLRAMARQEILNLAGSRVAVSGRMDFDFSRGRVVMGVNRAWPTRVSAMLVSAPLSAHRVVSYVLPTNVADVGYSSFLLPASSPLPGGIVSGSISTPTGFYPIDGAFVGHLRSTGQLPYHFRQRAVMSTAYQYVFSGAYVQMVMNASGMTHTGDLDVGDNGPPWNPALEGPWTPVNNPILSGVTEPVPRREFQVDVAQVRTGERLTAAGSLVRDERLLVLYTRGQTLDPKVVHLVDSGGTSDPLFLMLVGGGRQADGSMPVSQMQVVIEENITRPVVLVLYNCFLTASTTGLRVNGAILMDNLCAMPNADSFPQQIHVAHISYFAFSPSIGEAHFIADIPMPQAVEEMVPRATYVATQRYTP